jgi:hypothetical protein
MCTDVYQNVGDACSERVKGNDRSLNLDATVIFSFSIPNPYAPTTAALGMTSAEAGKLAVTDDGSFAYSTVSQLRFFSV